jgi:TDG/mug DNA glycosylase family protein
MPLIHSFAPISSPIANIIILGSMPGRASLLAGQYYAHPRNSFWPIMGDLIGAGPNLKYELRTHRLKSAGIALWDVLACCARESSLDAGIDKSSIIPNDFESFFLAHPSITHVFFNGATAEKCFQTYVKPSLKLRSLHYQRLPSTSPANASISYNRKLEAWEVITQYCRMAPAADRSQSAARAAHPRA